jgi:hypothetical protein
METAPTERHYVIRKVHRRATKLIISLKDKPYDERMKRIEVNNLRNKTD